MTTLVTTDVSDGTTIDAADLNNNLTAIKDVVNGNIDNSNIKTAAAIAASKLAGYPADISKALMGDGSWAMAATAQTVQVAGSVVAQTKLLSGDANPAWKLYGSGKMEWGAGGASAVDTNLYRHAANILRSDDSFVALDVGAWAAASTNEAIFAGLEADANRRFQVLANGKINWGDGTAAVDTNLYRVSANFLGTDDSFYSALWMQAGTSQATGNYAYITGVSGDAGFRLFILNNGQIGWGDGSGFSADVVLYRSAANVLATDDHILMSNSGQLRITNHIGSAVGGTNTYKWPIYDNTGSLLGYIPIWSA